MQRFDFLGVTGTGKSTIYYLLSQTRRTPNEFLLFDEAYDLALKAQFPLPWRLANHIQQALGTNRPFQPFARPLDRLINRELTKAKSSFEREKLFEQITITWLTYRDMLFLRLNGTGKSSLSTQEALPSDYLHTLLKTALRMKQFYLLTQSLPKKTNVVYNRSFSQKVFSVVDFSKKVDPDIICRYIKGMPAPAGVIICNASPQVIVSRLRERAKEGRVASVQRAIINTDLLEEWVKISCEVIQFAKSCLLEQGSYILDLNTEKEPHILAAQVREFMLGYHRPDGKMGQSVTH